jgi:hypothetical protein
VELKAWLLEWHYKEPLVIKVIPLCKCRGLASCHCWLWRECRFRKHEAEDWSKKSRHFRSYCGLVLFLVFFSLFHVSVFLHKDGGYHSDHILL